MDFACLSAREDCHAADCLSAGALVNGLTMAPCRFLCVSLFLSSLVSLCLSVSVSVRCIVFFLCFSRASIWLCLL